MTKNAEPQLSKEEPSKTLSAIEHLLRLYWSPEPFDMNDRALVWLSYNDLVVPSNLTAAGWRVTERGRAYVEAIRGLPLPVQVTEWRIPG